MVLAEQVGQWYEESEYDDLLTFERDLAHLSALTLLFVESAGSIAELGAFALLPPIQERLLVVVQLDHYRKPSFIYRGPLRFLEGAREASVLVYEWRVSGGEVRDFDTSDARDLADKVAAHLAGQPSERVFNEDEPGHLMLLVADLIMLLSISRLSEIRECLSAAEISVADSRLRRYLFVLQFFGLVDRFKYSNHVYYIAPRDDRFIHYDFTPEATIRDRDRWMVTVLEYFGAHDPRREAALRRYRQLALHGEDPDGTSVKVGR